jgi:hypothetical protein
MILFLGGIGSFISIIQLRFPMPMTISNRKGISGKAIEHDGFAFLHRANHSVQSRSGGYHFVDYHAVIHEEQMMRKPSRANSRREHLRMTRGAISGSCKAFQSQGAFLEPVVVSEVLISSHSHSRLSSWFS